MGKQCDETSQGVVTTAGVAQLIRASPFQGECCGFESHHPLQFGPIDYRLGRQVFILESRVRFPVGLL